MNSITRRRAGFTLTEMALVMGITGLVLSAIWVAAVSVMKKSETNRAIQLAETISQNVIREMHGRSFPGTSLPASILTDMIASGTVPTPAVTSTTTAVSPWGGPINIYAMTATTFRVSFYSISNDVCVPLLMQATAGCTVGDVGCPTQVILKSGLVTQLPDPTVGWKIMTLAEANSLCIQNIPTTSMSYTAGDNSLEFDYTLY